LGFIPVYNIYLILMLFFKKGTEGPNEYGPDPVFGTEVWRAGMSQNATRL
jgi:hypothetical protein